MTTETNKEDNRWGNFDSYIDAVEARIEELNDIDICLLFLNSANTFDFKDKFKQWVKIYEEKFSNKPSFNLVFVEGDLGDNEITKKSRLRFFKAMREDRFYRQYVKSITVKGNRTLVDLEPNVFSSGVKFEELK